MATQELAPPSTAPAGAPTPPARNRPQAKGFVVGLVCLLIAYLVLVPLVFLIRQVFFEDGHFSVASFHNAFDVVGFWTLARNSIVFALGATVVSVVIGVALAYLTERTNCPGKWLVYAVALTPLVIPGILYSVSWIILGAPDVGVLNELLSPIGVSFNIFSMLGMIFVQGLGNVSMAFLLMVAGFRSMDPTLEECARSAGGHQIAVLRRVTLPLAMPAIIATALLTFVRNIEAFEVPSLLGIPADVWVVPSQIWRVLDIYPPDYGAAGAYAIILIGVGGIGIWIYYRVLGEGRKYATVSGKGYKSGAVDLGGARWFAFAGVIGYTIVSIGLPFLALLYTSLRPFWGRVELGSLGSGLSFDNYGFIWKKDTLEPIWNSFVLAAGAATIVMVMMAVAAWLVIRSRATGRMALDTLSFVPLVLPGIVLGISILIVYINVPVPIYGTSLILLIAYITKSLPYGMRYASASIYQLSAELEESAYMSGATWVKTFRRVILPLLLPGLFAGWLYIMLSCISDLSSSLLLYSPDSEVMAVVIWQLNANAQMPQLAALGMFMIVALFAIVALAMGVSRRFGVQVRNLY